MTFPDEVLMAYADGELDPGTRAAVEAAMASDPQLARRVDRHRALRGRVRSAFDTVLDEPVPARLLEAVRAAPAGPGGDNVVPLPRRPVRRWRRPQWAAIAASLIVGLVAGRLASLRPGNAGPIATRGGRMLASGVLASALTEQLASSQSAADPVRIGVSFRAKSGEYCRTFSLRRPAALAGLACRAGENWRIGVLVEGPPAGAGTYRQAASPMPPALIAAVDAEIAGEPLDAPAEAAARARQWH
ncbi:MAG TPA: zf-HC2 domain-containing protein [Steroidobacteraceae bacterium]|nr:zf-HC2 domain-containing protein [Steroidobacteraceae bacterium]